MAKKFLYSTIIIFCLIFASSAQAQTSEIPARLDNPLQLPQNRLSITEDTASELELLAMWGLGQLNNVTWLDDTHLAVSGSGGTWLYDLAEPDTPYAVLPSLDPAGRNAAQSYLSPDGQWLTVEGNFESIFNYQFSFGVWHIETGNYYNRVPIHNRPNTNQPNVLFAGWLSDNRYAIADSTRIFINELSLDGAETITTFTHERNERTSYTTENIAISQDKQSISFVSRSDISEQVIVQVLDIETGERRILYEDDLLPQTPLFVDDLQFNADGTELAILVRFRADPDTYDLTTEVRRWSVESGEALPAYQIDCGAIELIFEHNAILCQKRMYEIDAYEIEIRDLSTNESLFDSVILDIFFPGGLQQFAQSFINYDALLAIAHNRDEQSDAEVYPHNIIIWNMENQEIVGLDADLEHIKHIAINPGAMSIAVLQEDQVRIYDIATNSELAVIEQTGLQSITDLALSPDGNYLISVGAYPAFIQYSRQTPARGLYWDLSTGTFDILPGQDAAVSVAYRPDGTQFAIGGHDGNIDIFSADTLTRQNTLFNDGNVAQMTYSHDGFLLVTANGRYYRFWDMQDLTVVNRLPDGFSRSPIRFTLDDEWLVTRTGIFDVEDNGRLVAVWTSDDSDERDQIINNGNTQYNRISRYLSQNGIRFDEEFSFAYTDDLIIVGTSDGVIYLYGIRGEAE